MIREKLANIGKKVTELIFSKQTRTTLALSVALGAPTLLYDQQVETEIKPCIEVGFNPDTIRNNTLDSTHLEVTVFEGCRAGLKEIETSLVNPSFAIDGQSPPGNYAENPILVRLNDQGIGGDRVAGDWIFTSDEIQVKDSRFLVRDWEGITGLAQSRPLQAITYFDREGSIQKFGGLTLRFVDDLEKTFLTPQLWILDPSVPLTTRADRFRNFQIGNHIINIRDDQSLANLTLSWIDWGESSKPLTQLLYSIEPDTDPYHFLIIASSTRIFITPHDSSLNTHSAIAIPTHRDFSGTGAPKMGPEFAQSWGSKGQLRLITALTSYVEGRYSDMFNHEITHWVGAFLHQDLGLNDDRGHWKDNTSVAGVLGGTQWTDNGDGTFTVFDPVSRRQLSKLELYLFGWIPSEQVDPINVALDEKQHFGQGKSIHGPFRTVTIQDIIAQHGIRVPGPDTSLRHFQVGFIYPTKDRFATPAEMTVRELYAKHLSQQWRQATNSHSTAEFIVPLAPRIREPVPEAILPTLNIPIEFKPPQDTKSIHLQLIPANNDGPGVDLLLTDEEIIKNGKFSVPAPVIGRGPYINLPGMGYTWRIRTSSSLKTPEDTKRDAGWTPWVERNFRTPPSTSETIRLLSPINDETIDKLNPSIKWDNSNKSIFYYEVQLSKDPTFNTDPQTATAAVYWNLIHGGVTNPLNSYTIPDSFPLERDKTYYWRVRLRIQGDGTAVEWSTISSFRTSAEAKIKNVDWAQVQKNHWQQITNSLH